MKVLILGSSGSLGAQLHRTLPNATAWDRSNIDVTNFSSLREKILALAPDTIINCTAYNAVDSAESHEAEAVLLNAAVPAELAKIANEINALLVHVSTGYVFDGTKAEYAEDDKPHPVNVYGKSKLAGERAVSSACKKFYVVRTNVLFGSPGTSATSKKSFVDMMLSLAAAQQTVKAVDDEVNSITYVPDLALQIAHLIDSGKPYGTYHVTNTGSASWLELAREVFRLENLTVDVVPVHGSEFKRPALRPQKIVLANTKLPNLRTWQEALREYLST